MDCTGIVVLCTAEITPLEKGLGGGFKARLTFGPSNLYGDTLRRPLVSTDGHKFETLHNMANQAEEAEAVLFVHKTSLKGSKGDSLDFGFFAFYRVPKYRVNLIIEWTGFSA